MARTRTSHTDLLQILADDNEIQTSLAWSLGCILYWKLGAQGWKGMSWIVSFNSHFACTFAILTSNRHYKWRNRSARLMFEDKEGSISLKASKRKLQNKSHWTHILTNFWWNWRALHFKTMFVRYCKTINKGFNYISCTLVYSGRKSDIPKIPSFIFSQTCSFPHNPNSDNDTSIP